MTNYEIINSHTALIILKQGSMHTLNQAQREELFEALIFAEQDSAVKAVVITGKDGLFSVGGDLAEFDQGQAFTYPHLTKDLFYLIENYQKPVIASVEGFALGGGLELAMACHARVASSKCKVGLPESKIGLIPGGEGTQRIIRALGIEQGISLMLSGEIYSADQFINTSLFNVVTQESALEEALRLADKIIAEPHHLTRLSQIKLDMLSAEPILEFAKLQLRTFPHYSPALEAILEVVQSGLQSFKSGCEREAEIFQQLIQSQSSISMRHLFFAEKAALKTPKSNETLSPIQHAAVIGAGFMGQGIAACLNSVGIDVKLYDVNQLTARKAVEKIALMKDIDADKIHVLDELNNLDTVDLVIEAVSENLTLKQSIFSQLDQVCVPSTILASNTSSLDLDQIAAVTQHPERVIGLHFFGPVAHMKLLEIVQGAQTANSVLIQAKRLAQRIHKIPVVSQVGPGFIGNRIFDAYLSQALELASQGISPEKIDRTMRNWGMKMGPFQVMDLIGNDLLVSAWNGKFSGKGVQLLNDLVAEGHFGLKTQQGWYHYNGKNIHFDVNLMTELLHSDFKSNFIPEDVVKKLIFSLYAEGLQVLKDEIASSKADIDLTFIHGYGFPAVKGGPMQYIEQQYSAALIYRQLQQYVKTNKDPLWSVSVTDNSLEKIA